MGYLLKEHGERVAFDILMIRMKCEGLPHLPVHQDYRYEDLRWLILLSMLTSIGQNYAFSIPYIEDPPEALDW